MADARFEDGAEQPLRLLAESAEDLTILSALTQDAVFTAADLRYSSRDRRLDLLLNRFRWEDADRAAREGRKPERTRAILTLCDVTRLSRQGIEPGDKDQVLSLLALSFEPGEDGTGALILTLAGDGAIRAEVECVNLQLADVTRPYAAPSGKMPSHPES